MVFRTGILRRVHLKPLLPYMHEPEYHSPLFRSISCQCARLLSHCPPYCERGESALRHLHGEFPTALRQPHKNSLRATLSQKRCTRVLLASGAAESNTDRTQTTARMKCAVFVGVIGLTLIAGKHLEVCNACERRLWHVALSLARDCK